MAEDGEDSGVIGRRSRIKWKDSDVGCLQELGDFSFRLMAEKVDDLI